MTSRPVVFGPEGNLVGVVTEPDQVARRDVAFIMFNSGVLPRLGPHRMNVKMAQRLGVLGLYSLRFDLAGLGDSRPQEVRQPAVADLKAAMDVLEERFGIRRFALIGVCSGAITIYEAAIEDKRVIGVLMFDGYCYLTRRTRWAKYWKRARKATVSEWIASVRNRFRRLRRFILRSAAPQAGIISSNAITPNPPKETFAGEMQKLVDRGAVVFVVFSGSFIDYYSYADQFKDAFAGYDFVRHVRCEYREDIDHTFVMRESQAKMLDVVSSWVPEVERAAGTAA